MWGGGGFLVLAIGMLLGWLLHPKAAPVGAPTVPVGAPGSSNVPMTGGSPLTSDPRATDRATVGHVTVVAVPIAESNIAFLVTITDPTKNLQFSAWTDRIATVPPMTDEFGNTYKAEKIDTRHPIFMSVRYTALNFINERATKPHLITAFNSMPKQWGDGSGQVTSEYGLSDLITYDPLVPKAKKMLITLPAKNVGGVGTLRFEFNVDKVREMTAWPE